jgi:excinuclease UvrABC nuclease subunit
MNQILEDKLEALPALPGIYQFFNEKAKLYM